MPRSRLHKSSPSANGSKPTLRLIEDGWDRNIARLHLQNESEDGVAEAVGINAVTIWRVKTGKAAPGPKFIASALKTMRGARFEELFEITEEAR